MLLDRFPRVSLSHAPTPLEPLDRLRSVVGGPRLWIKRDDCTGLAQGGNKARKLEFLVADALAQGCDTLITPGCPVEPCADDGRSSSALWSQGACRSRTPRA